MYKKVLNCAVLFMSLLIIFLSIYINNNFNNVSFEQIIATILHSEKTSFSAIKNGIIFVILNIIISFLVIFLIKYLISKIKKTIVFKIKNKEYQINIYKSIIKYQKFIFGGFFVFSVIFMMHLLNIFPYIKSQLSKSKLIEGYYIDAKDVDLSFPEKKQNLIYIFVESLETANISSNNGGIVERSYTPNLENLALNNINFSNTNKIGGALQVYGTSWTAAAMIAQTAGIPLKVGIDYNNYSGFGESLPGAYSIGDILKENGYTNYLMMGSDASFGGRRDYFTYHGDYKIYDYVYAKENKLIDSDYYVWWGYEDNKLFQFAKDKLLEISSNEEPFNFTMLTADTHFVDGYFDESCPIVFDSQYANVFNCADKMLIEFINWIKKQNFYKDTTIIISGDHLTMQEGFYQITSDKYERTTFNTFINSRITTNNSKERMFSTMDMFPTTLASLGVEIDGDRLGLGTNLFSDKKTLVEIIGEKELSNELAKRSNFYNKQILGDTYYQMINKTNKQSNE